MSSLSPVATRQVILQQEGFYKGKIDGSSGPLTLQAELDFKTKWGSMAEICPSPNYTASENPCRGVVWHHSCGSWAGDKSWIQNPDSEVSYHAEISLKGEIVFYVPFKYRAWHAGKSIYRGLSGCNAFMIGIAFTGDTYERELNDRELESAKKLFDRFDFSREWTTDHRTVSPGRKNDLSPKQFDRLMDTLF